MSSISLHRNAFVAFFAILLSAGILSGCGKTGLKDLKEEWGRKLEDNANAFRSAKVEKTVSYIADRFPNGSVAFMIEETFYNNSDSEQRILLDEIRKRLVEKGLICDEILIVGESGQTADPLDATVMKKKLDQVYDKVDIVVNFAGLPKSDSELRKIAFLARKNTATGKNNMLLMCDTGLAAVDQDMIRSGRVCAIVDYVSPKGPNARFDMTQDAAPNDPDAAFDCVSFFVNADTLDRFIEDGNEDFFLR